MADLSTPELPPKSHNNPPSDLEILEDRLAIRHVSLIRDVDAKNNLATKIPAVFTEQGDATFVSDFIKEIYELQKSLKSTHKEEKEPFLRQGQLVDEFFNSRIKSLADSILKASAPLEAWLRKCAAEEQARRDAEATRLRKEQESAIIQAAQKPTEESVANVAVAVEAAHVAQQVAAAPVVSMAAATGKYSRAALKEDWVGEIKVLGDVDLEKLRAYIKPEALQVALNAYVKMGGRECKGCVIEKKAKVGVK